MRQVYSYNREMNWWSRPCQPECVTPSLHSEVAYLTAGLKISLGHLLFSQDIETRMQEVGVQGYSWYPNELQTSLSCPVSKHLTVDGGKASCKTPLGRQKCHRWEVLATTLFVKLFPYEPYTLPHLAPV